MSEIVTVAQSILNPTGTWEQTGADNGVVNWNASVTPPAGFRALAVVESAVYAEFGSSAQDYGSVSKLNPTGTSIEWRFAAAPVNSPVYGTFTVAFFRD